MDDIASGHFSKTMMADWAKDDANLLRWRKETRATAFEQAPPCDLRSPSRSTTTRAS
jgi:ketol-acid reductoisomerase